MASSMFVLNLGSWWLSTSRLSFCYLREFFIHSVAWVAGSMIRGVLIVFIIIIAFSMDRPSAGRPSFFQVSIYCSEDKKFLKLKSFNCPLSPLFQS